MTSSARESHVGRILAVRSDFAWHEACVTIHSRLAAAQGTFTMLAWTNPQSLGDNAGVADRLDLDEAASQIDGVRQEWISRGLEIGSGLRNLTDADNTEVEEAVQLLQEV